MKNMLMAYGGWIMNNPWHVFVSGLFHHSSIENLQILTLMAVRKFRSTLNSKEFDQLFEHLSVSLVFILLS